MASQVEQSDGEPGGAARHEASLDEAGTLTNPDAADEDGESTDDQAGPASGPRAHLTLIPLG